MRLLLITIITINSYATELNDKRKNYNEYKVKRISRINN